MKLVTYHTMNDPKERVGILKEDHVVCLPDFATMQELIESSKTPKEIEELGKGREEGKDVILDAPIPRPRQDVLCLGLNYYAHAEEAHSFAQDAFDLKKKKTVYFSKRCAYAPGTKAGIYLDEELTQKMDYETELGVIIGKEAYKVNEEEADDYIFGYTVINDLSARDLQTAHTQWYFGKSLDGYCPMGPCIVTKDEFTLPLDLYIRCHVNGELRQDSRTSNMIHTVPEVIAEFSRGIRLLPGTIISTGTPEGTCMGMKEPVFLKKGDTVVCEIEGIGVLENTIV